MPDKLSFTFARSADQITVRVRADRNLYEIIPVSIWLACWLIGEMLLSSYLLYSRPADSNLTLLFLAMLAIWNFIGLYFSFRICWRLFGIEKLSIDSKSVCLEKSLFGIGKTWTYPIHSIENLRVTIPKEIPWLLRRWRPLGIFTGKISFDAPGDSHSFALGARDAEAYALLDVLKRRLQTKDAPSPSGDSAGKD